MHKLILILLLMLYSNAWAQKRELVLVSLNNNDTAIVNYRYYKDTASFTIKVGYKDKNERHQSYIDKTIILKKGSEIKPEFFYFSNRIDNKAILIKAKPSNYFKKRTGNIKTDYQKIVEEPTAFIYNGIKKIKCLNVYSLQINNYSGLMKLYFHPDFGLVELYINNAGEEVESTVIQTFKLVTVDGEKFDKYIKRFCP